MRKGRPKVALILTAEKRQRLESFAHRPRSPAALARRPDDGRVAVIVPTASYRPPLAVSKMSPKLREN